MTIFHRAVPRWSSLIMTLFCVALLICNLALAQSPKANSGQKAVTRQVPGKPTPAKPAAPKAAPATQPAPVARPATSNDKPVSDEKPVVSDEKPTPTVKSEPIEVGGKYLLRYKFKMGETLRWEVEHKAEVRTTVAGTTQTAETTTASVKAWVVTRVHEDGNAKFTHLVERVDMRNKLTGRQEVHYNSQTDKKAPEGFEQMAKEVGVPLTLVLTDNKGTVLQRQELLAAPNSRTGQIVVPLPTERVAVGDVWNIPKDVPVTLKDKSVKQVKTRQRFKLESVNNNIAVLQVESQILSPIHDPQLEAQLIQYDFNGTIRFDLEAGRVISQQCDLDKRVHGFQGDASTMHYVTRFTEKLLPSSLNTATRPVVGPEQK